MNVLSLFDGMGCSWIALRELGVTVDKGYASETDKFAIAQTKLNFPDVIHLGDVNNWQSWDIHWSSIDLVMAGSPCQGFSFAGKGLAFDDPRSKLFFVFVDILNACKMFNPDVKFLLENVDMKKEYRRIISEYLGLFPVLINSALVSAQNRKRWYWTNIRTKKVGLFGETHTDIPQPEDRGILLKDILQPESEIAKKYYLSETALARINRKMYSDAKVNPDKSGTLNTKNNSGQLSVDSGTTLIIADKDVGHNPKVFDDGKTPPLRSTNGCSHDIKVGVGVVNNNGELNHQDKANCLDANYTKGMDNHTQRTMVLSKYHEKNIRELDEKGASILSSSYKGAQANGMTLVAVDLKTAGGKSKTRRGGVSEEKCQTLDTNCYNGVAVLSEPIHKHGEERTYTDKAPTIQARYGTGGDNVPYVNKLRRLTPKECARLQTIPEWYDWGKTSDSQIYKLLGNGWTCEVIRHILSYML